MLPASLLLMGAVTQLRVMPLGDSMTAFIQPQSAYLNAFRACLPDERIQLVGSNNGINEGHPGWKLWQLADQAPQLLRANPPHIILLQAGTNDMDDSVETAVVLGRMERLLRVIRATDPSIAVYVVGIPPVIELSRHRITNAKIEAFNAGLPSVVKSCGYSYAGASPFKLSHISPDGIHPGGEGLTAAGTFWGGIVKKHLGT